MIKYSFKNKKRIVNLKYMFKKLLHYNFGGGWGLLSTELNSAVLFFFLPYILLKNFEVILKLLKHDQVVYPG